MLRCDREDELPLGHSFDKIVVEITFMRMRKLTDLTGVAERQIRYLIAEGFIPPPRGGRANADYGEDHVAAIRRYTRLRELGFPPAAIKLLLQAKEGAPFPVGHGVTLVVDPAIIGSGTDARPLAERIVKLLSELLKEKK
jgi:MerR family transcriptional regulator, copper efflux regulator